MKRLMFSNGEYIEVLQGTYYLIAVLLQLNILIRIG